MNLQYEITLVYIRIKSKSNYQMVVTNKRSNVKLVPTLVDDLYVFNEKIVMEEARKHKQHLELLISFVGQLGQTAIGGAIMLNRFELQPSEEPLELKLHNCLDPNASCQIIVNSITPIDSFLSPSYKKQGESSITNYTSIFRNKHHIRALQSPNINDKSNWLSGHKSTKSEIEVSFDSDERVRKL